MAELSQFEYNNVVYDLKDTIARSMINAITETFADALDNHTDGYEGLAFKTVSGHVVTFDIRDLD